MPFKEAAPLAHHTISLQAPGVRLHLAFSWRSPMYISAPDVEHSGGHRGLRAVAWGRLLRTYHVSLQALEEPFFLSLH